MSALGANLLTGRDVDYSDLGRYSGGFWDPVGDTVLCWRPGEIATGTQREVVYFVSSTIPCSYRPRML